MCRSTESVKWPAGTAVPTVEVPNGGLESVVDYFDEKSKEGWDFVGLFTFKDPARKDTAPTIQKARDYGVDIKMITGDQIAIARTMGKEIRLGKDPTKCEINEWLGPGLRQEKEEEGQEWEASFTTDESVGLACSVTLRNTPPTCSLLQGMEGLGSV